VPRCTEAYTGNFSLARATFLELGGFDESFRAYGHEDYELVLRLLKAGGELVFSPAAVAYQHQEKDFPALARDAMARGKTAVLFASKHPEIAAQLKLGAFDSGTRKWRRLRSVMLALTGVFPGLPRVVIALISALERRPPRRLDRYYTMALDYFYWVGARTALRLRGPAPGR
jgi:GT2 family glycosyltransferase